MELTCNFDSVYVTALEDKFYLTLSYIVRYRCAIIIIIIIIIIMLSVFYVLLFL